MIRLFETNKIRNVYELEGDWDFQPINEGDSVCERYEYRMPVPACWELHPDFRTYRGKAAYRRKVDVSKDTSIKLNFKGVSHTADVYWNGMHVAHHYNAYTPFSTFIKDVEKGEHELVVIVDNTFSEKSKLHIANDYYTYGGIIRPASIEYISDVCIDRLSCTSFQKDGVWGADIKVWVTNHHDTIQKVEIKGQLADTPISFGFIEIQANETVDVQINKMFEQLIPWELNNPSLYLLTVHVYTDHQTTPVDDLIERVGFRTVTTENGRIQLNGQDIILKGYNRHEDHPLVGASFPYQLLVQDLELLIETGANSVRTSHYPNDERFLDLCDERGIAVWEENHARGLVLDQMSDPLFQKQCMDCNEEMVQNHVNHPSILIWAILNECASNTQEGKVMYKEQLEQIKELDSSRPVTYATHHREHDICFDLADIISFNLYPLWYTDEDPGELVDQARIWAEELGGGGKPIIMSEFGGDGYYGLRHPNAVRGTEERQAIIIEENLRAYTKRSFISGMYIWQFADCKVVEDTGWLMSRAGTKNSKGIFDEFRRPKLAASVVKKYFSE